MAIASRAVTRGQKPPRARRARARQTARRRTAQISCTNFLTFILKMAARAPRAQSRPYLKCQFQCLKKWLKWRPQIEAFFRYPKSNPKNFVSLYTRRKKPIGYPLWLPNFWTPKNCHSRGENVQKVTFLTGSSFKGRKRKKVCFFQNFFTFWKSTLKSHL